MASQTRTTWRIHVGLVVAEILCIFLFFFELSRALGGNTLSWAYVVEWPVLGAYAIFMWRRLLQQERGESPKRRSSSRPTSDEPDPQLDAWNAYLAKVHQADQRPVAPPTDS